MGDHDPSFKRQENAETAAPSVENGDAANELTYLQSMRFLVLRLAAVLGVVLLLLLFMTGGAASIHRVLNSVAPVIS